MVDLSAVLTPAEGRPIEIITQELLEAKVAGGRAILTIGQRLIEAKAVLPRGEWLPWLEDKAEFSERSAQNFMALAQEYGANPQALADLGATKALQLLALSGPEREDFLKEPHIVGGEQKLVPDMSTRELKQALAARKAAQRAAEQSAAEAAKAKEQLEAAQIELAELKSRPVDVAVMAVDQEVIDKAKAEAVAKMAQELDEANEARRVAENKLSTVKAMADKELISFDSWFTLTQELVNKMSGVISLYNSRDDTATVAKLKKALRALGEAIGRAGQ